MFAAIRQAFDLLNRCTDVAFVAYSRRPNRYGSAMAFAAIDIDGFVKSKTLPRTGTTVATCAGMLKKMFGIALHIRRVEPYGFPYHPTCARLRLQDCRRMQLNVFGDSQSPPA